MTQNCRMPGIIFFTAAVFFMAGTALLSALEVNQTELKSAGGTDSVVFKNYTGPHAKIDSLASIRGIGTKLGQTFANSPEKAGTSGTENRYYVIHAIDPSVKEKLDADILIIGTDATVDHIRNVRYIIAAYLSAAYKYSQSDAETIATFVTVYNAVYRGQLDTFKNKYKNVVIKNLSADKAGLALDYKDWAGKSQIVIPLSDPNGGLSTIETSVISDKQVVQSLQNQTDKGIPDRKSMVDIKEREAGNANKNAQEAQKQAVNAQTQAEIEKQKLKTTQNEAQTALQKAEKAQQDAEQAKKTAEANPDNKQIQQDAEKAQQDAEQKQKEALRQQQDAEIQKKVTEDIQKKAEDAQTAAAEQQAKADKKLNEAQSERTTIAKDQQQIIDNAAESEPAPVVYGMKLTDERKLLSAMVKINARTGKIVQESPVAVIRNRSAYAVGENYLVIAGESSGNKAVKLVLLDGKTMEITAESKETVAEDSVLIQAGAYYYCVIRDGSNWVLGKYNSDLSLNRKSTVAVKSGTPVSISDTGICVTTGDGTVKLLNPEDLEEITGSR